MLKKEIDQLPFFVAGDATYLTEVLHPENDLLNLPYSLAFAQILPGESSLPHVLEQDEVYIFTKGVGSITIEEKNHQVSRGMIVLVPGGSRQFVTNATSENLEFYCIVSPPWSEEKERILTHE